MNSKFDSYYAALPIAVAVVGGGLGIFAASFPFIIYQQGMCGSFVLKYSLEKKAFGNASMLRAASFSFLWMVISAFHAIRLAPLLLFAPSSVPLLAHQATGRMANWLTWFFGGTIEVIGSEKIPSDEAVIFVVNHQSMLDIALFYKLVSEEYQFAWVSKSTVFLIPGVGWIMKLAKYIALERGKKKSVLEMFQQCIDTLDNGVSVVMFPQGTRDRQLFLPFKDGAFTLAMSSKRRIVPVSLNVPKNAWISNKWKATLTVHDPIVSQGENVTVDSLKTHCYDVISNCLQVKKNSSYE